MILQRSCSVAWGNPNSHGLIKLWRTTAFYNSPVLAGPCKLAATGPARARKRQAPQACWLQALARRRAAGLPGPGPHRDVTGTLPASAPGPPPGRRTGWAPAGLET